MSRAHADKGYRPDASATVSGLYRWDNFDRVSLSQLYQFRAARRWQPYVGAGIAVDTEALRDTRNDYRLPPLQANQRLTDLQAGMNIKLADTYPSASALPHVTTTNVRTFAKAGFKLHFGHLGMFLLTEVQVANGVHRLAPLRIGIGADLF